MSSLSKEALDDAFSEWNEGAIAQGSAPNARPAPQTLTAPDLEELVRASQQMAVPHTLEEALLALTASL